MTTFFTVLIMTYTAGGEELQARWVYESEIECSVALAAVDNLMPAERLLATQCAKSDIISWAPRPTLRGE